MNDLTFIFHSLKSRWLNSTLSILLTAFGVSIALLVMQFSNHIQNRLNADGKDIDIKFMSPLARQQDAEDILTVQQAVQFVLQNAGPDQAKIGFKLEDFGTWVAGKTGMPAELVRSQTEKQQVIQAGAQAAQQGMDAQGQPPVDQGQTAL